MNVISLIFAAALAMSVQDAPNLPVVSQVAQEDIQPPAQTEDTADSDPKVEVRPYPATLPEPPPPTVKKPSFAPANPSVVRDVAIEPRPLMVSTSPADYEAKYLAVSQDGKTLHVMGEIKFGLAKRFRKKLEQNEKVETVVLSSDGGIILEGLAMGEIIAQRGLNTHVEMVCASACTLAYIKGRKRSISERGAIGFHQASNRKLLSFAPNKDEVGNLVMRKAYIDAGVGLPVIQRALETSPEDMWFPDHDTLLASAIVKERVPVGKVKFAKGRWDSAHDLFARVDGDKLWQAVARSRPELYHQSLSVAWNMAMTDANPDVALRSARDEIVRVLILDSRYYSDSLINDYISLQAALWKAAESKRNWRCSTFLPTLDFPVAGANGDGDKASEQRLLLQMLASDFQRSELGEEETRIANARTQAFWAKVVAASDFDSRDVVGNFCRQPEVYFDVLMEQAPAERAAIWRSLTIRELPKLPF